MWESNHDGAVSPDGTRRLIFRTMGEIPTMGGPDAGSLLVLEKGDTQALYLDSRAGDTALWSDDGRFVVFFTFVSQAEGSGASPDSNRIVVADLETMEIRHSRTAYSGLALEGLDGTLLTARFNTLKARIVRHFDIRTIDWYRRRTVQPIAWTFPKGEAVGPAQLAFLRAQSDAISDWHDHDPPVWELHPDFQCADAAAAAFDTTVPPHASAFDTSGVPRPVAVVTAPLLLVFVGIPLLLVAAFQAVLDFCLLWGWCAVRTGTGRRMKAEEIGPARQKVQAISRSAAVPLLWPLRLPLRLLSRLFPPKSAV